jgi:hypothetical protein
MLESKSQAHAPLAEMHAPGYQEAYEGFTTIGK